jgi:hypothetical protein
MKKTLYIALFLILFPSDAFASERWELRSGKNTLAVIGTCSEKEVRFDLYQKGNDEPIYTSGALCIDGAFEFSDNLLQWETLGDGSYELVVDKERKKKVGILIERPVEVTPMDTVSAAIPTSVDGGAGASAPRFLDAFVALQQSLADMRVRLAESEYPDIVKISLDAAIDGIDKISGKMTDILFASESGASEIIDETVTPETSSGIVQTEAALVVTDHGSEVPTANGGDVAASALKVDRALLSDGLSISGQNESGMTVADDN